MSSTRIFYILFLITSLGMAFYLYSRINSSIEQADRIAAAEQKIIDQLISIRDAEMAYISVNGEYTDNWDSLIQFVKEGEFYVIEKTETIFELSYGADSVYVQIDTLGTVAVYDSLFANRSNFNPDRLPFVPGYQETKFKVSVDRIDKSGILVPVIEVWNPKPVNPEREVHHELNKNKTLRFGSLYSVTTSGNWE